MTNRRIQKHRRGKRGLKRIDKSTDETASVESKSLQNLKLLSRQRGRANNARRHVSVRAGKARVQRPQETKIHETEPDRVISHNCYSLVALDDSDSDTDSDDGAVVVPCETINLQGAWLSGPPQSAERPTTAPDDTVQLVRPLSCWADEVSDDET